MYVKISDGIFLEVGGTSTDISVIKNGKPQVKSAQIGKNRLFLRTLDVRTLGIAGGSVPRFAGNKITDVGPRSAHIAKLKYISYSGDSNFKSIELESVKPLPGDPGDYMAVKAMNSLSAEHTITPTGASYFLELVKVVGHGSANIQNLKDFFESIAQKFGRTAKEIAEEILTISAKKIEPVIKQLTREYKLDPDLIEFIGGGGGASAIVPFTANYMNKSHRIAENSEVISAIGAALGIIRDSVEKNIVNPTESDILSLRQEAMDSVVAMGAVPETVEVTIEIDNQNKKVIATAMGSGEMRTKDLGVKELSKNEVIDIAAKSLRCSPTHLKVLGKTAFLYAISYHEIKKVFFGMISREINKLRVVDQEGTIRLQLNDAFSAEVAVTEAKTKISELIGTLTTFGDAGALVPDIFLLISGKIVDLTGLMLEQQVLSIVDIELKALSPNDTVVVIAAKKK